MITSVESFKIAVKNINGLKFIHVKCGVDNETPRPPLNGELMSLDNFPYYMPTKIIYGRNSLKDIDIYVNHRKALLVTSQGFVKRAWLMKLLLILII